MLQGLRTHPPPEQPRVLAKLVAGIDYLVPFLDIGVIFFWVPGVILFLFGYPLIFGWWSSSCFRSRSPSSRPGVWSTSWSKSAVATSAVSSRRGYPRPASARGRLPQAKLDSYQPVMGVSVVPKREEWTIQLLPR